MRRIIKSTAVIAAVCMMSVPVLAEDSSTGGMLGKIVQKGKDVAANNIEPAASASFNFGGNNINAKAGECYGQVTTPAVTKTEQKRVLVSPESKKIANIIPAKYKTVTEQIVVKEATEELVTIPATYKTVTETITVTPASKKLVKVPAKYAEKKVRVMVKPARTVWKKGESSSITRVSASGEVMCLVEIPAEYDVITKRELVSAETTREEVVPAVTRTIERRVVDEPAKVQKKMIPAVTKTVEKKVLVTPEEIQYKTIPAEYKTITQETVVTAQKADWKRILCKTNATEAGVKELQRALNRAGFSPGNIDGVLGYDTYKAVDKFQRAKGLSRGEITYDTLQALGVSI